MQINFDNKVWHKISAFHTIRPIKIQVTVHDGQPLTTGEIIAPIVGDAAHDHNNFQDAEVSIQAGGMRGRQYQVLVKGT